MKKTISLFTIMFALVSIISGQTVSNYTYKLDNGIIVKSEKCWNQVWVSQTFGAMTPGDKNPVSVTFRTLGDLTSSPSYKLISSGKEIKGQDAKPGTYSMRASFKLTGKPGSLNFDIDNIQIKAGSKTTVAVTLYDFQVLINEAAGSQGGNAAYTSIVNSYKGTPDNSQSMGIIGFYEKGKHEAVLTPASVTNNKAGKIKPGTYDVVLAFGSSGKIQKLWLENFTMKADVSYTITVSLNAGVVSWAGTVKDVKALQLYPAGTAARQGTTAAPDKNAEILKIDNASISGACPPGSYDVLLNIKNGAKYEWRKNIVVQTGVKVSVR